MKTKEEIVIQAKAYAESIGNEDGTSAYDYVMGYNQCQEDMADKLSECEMVYSDGYKKFEKKIIDLHRKHGYFQGDNLKVLIREFESLNKQD